MKTGKLFITALLLFCIFSIGNQRCINNSRQSRDSVEIKIDTLVARMGISSETPGGVVGVVKNGRLIFKKAWGLANYETKEPNTTSTLFNLGSVSKQFTAAAILLLEKEKKLSIKDDIRKYLPDFPDYGYTITIENLIHHTSGIKSSDVLSLMAGSLFSKNTHESDFDFITRQKSLNFRPGDEFLYSNSGYVLLAKIVEKTSGIKFSKFIEERIFKPSGMTHSYVYDSPDKSAGNSATGYIRGGDEKYKKSGYLNSTLVGISNVFTCIEDLMQWDNNFYTNKLGKWDFSKEMSTLTILNNGDTCKYAFGLDISEHNGLKTIGHGGGTGDFSTQYIHIPSERIAVICMFNISADASGLAYKVADLFVKGKPKPAAVSVPHEKVKVDSSVIQKYAGIYLDDINGFVATISRDSDHLVFEAPYQGRLELYPSSDSSFFVTFADLRFIFRKDENGEVKSATIIQRNQKFYLTYLGTDVFPLKPEQLHQYAGDYYCEDINVTYPVIFKDNKLYVIFPESTAKFTGVKAESELISEYADYFASPLSGILFTRDTRNEISGFILKNVGRVRNLVFVKIRK
jgi:CubicO group peptidase (beta-lactamase class C family)